MKIGTKIRGVLITQRGLGPSGWPDNTSTFKSGEALVLVSKEEYDEVLMQANKAMMELHGLGFRYCEQCNAWAALHNCPHVKKDTAPELEKN